jgi:6-pyruvoyltetrahydropterin/6-carboxytetrahydropterin synthase
MMRLTRRYRFSASHRLHSDQLSDDDNSRIYGKCNNPFGHGHDYVLDVAVRGPLDLETGRIVDLDKLDGLVGREIVTQFEHKNLNADVAPFETVVPTTENLAVEIRRRLEQAWPAAFGGQGPALDRIRIEETKRNYIELE